MHGPDIVETGLHPEKQACTWVCQVFPTDGMLNGGRCRENIYPCGVDNVKIIIIIIAEEI